MREMSSFNARCECCGTEISPQAPEFYVELECFRLISERGEYVPRRGSSEYHEAMERLRPKIGESYFRNQQMYDHGHLWCPVCGCKMTPQQGVGGA